MGWVGLQASSVQFSSSRATELRPNLRFQHDHGLLREHTWCPTAPVRWWWPHPDDQGIRGSRCDDRHGTHNCRVRARGDGHRHGFLRHGCFLVSDYREWNLRHLVQYYDYDDERPTRWSARRV